MAYRMGARESATTLASIALVALVVTVCSFGAAIYLDAQGTRGVQTGISQHSGAELALTASLSLGANGERQDAEVRAAIEQTFAGSGISFDVTRTLASHVTIHPVDPDAETEDRGGSAASIPDFDDLAELVEGTSPSGAIEVAVQADAADELNIVPGQEVLIAGVPFTVSGTWRPRDAQDPRWFGDPMVVTGFDDDFGPFVINEDAWRRLDANPEVTWTLVPDATGFDARNVPIVIDAWGSIRDDWRVGVSGIQSLTSQNRLVTVLRELEARLEGLTAVQPVASTALAAIGLVVMFELVRLLAVTRRRRTELYWARGDSTRRIAARAARAVGETGLVGALVGVVIVGTVVLATGGGVARLNPGVAAAVPPLLVLLASVVFAALSNRQVGGADLSRSVRQRRRRGVAVPGAVVLAVLAAAFSVWQLRLYGSPLTPTADGTGGVDPLAVVAPAAALVAAVLLVVTVFPRGAALYERRAGRSSVVAQLAARGLVRRLALVSAPLVVVALAVGSATTAAGFSATWASAFDETSALRVGSDLHANARLDGISGQAQDAALALESADAIAPIEVQPLSVGSQSGTILAAAPDAVADLANDIPGTFDPVTAAESIRVSIPGPVIPADTSALTFTFESEGFVAPPDVALWVTNAVGFLRLIPLDTIVSEVSGDDEQSFTHEDAAWDPPVAGPWRIAAIDFTFADQSFELDPANLHLTDLMVTSGGATSEVPLDEYWIADNPGALAAPPTTDASGTGLFLSQDTATARLTPSLNGAAEDRVNFPILISQQLANRFTVEDGDPFAFAVQDGIERLNATVAGIIPAVPGAPLETALLVDLGVIQHFQLRTQALPADPRDLWITTANPDATAAELRSVLPASTRIDSADDRAGRQVLGSAAVVLWASAGAALLLAIIGVASSARARLRAGRNDLGVLRALGVRDQDQAAIVAREFVIVLVVGAIAGLAAGLLVCVLTIPYFARAAVTLPYLAIPTALKVDVLGLAIALALLTGGVTLILLVLRQTIRTIARHAVPSEESE